MKAAALTDQPGEQSRNLQARVEIQNFLLALDSYPTRFACEPDLSFEQHLNRLGNNRTGHRRLEKSRLNGLTVPVLVAPRQI